MKLNRILGAFPALLLAIFFVAHATAQSDNYRLSEPYTYKNLTIFLIHGKDQTSKKNILTLQEAMEEKLFVVYETSDVNELEVENLSKEFDVFIQSGDIVKGGKQDRILAVSIIIPARSGRVSIQAFCVESGRWTKRGNEDSNKFNSSNDRIVTKELKLAANSARSQSEVWAKVDEAQEKLGKGVGGAVSSKVSSSSLQLAIENEKVVATTDDYIKHFAGIIDGKSDVIGYAFAINGKINSADTYASNALFKKLWIKMLRATATEAVSESREVRLADPVKAEAVKTFMDDADKAGPAETSVSDRAKIISRENKDSAVFEARDEKQKVTIHKSYVKKQ